MLIIACDMRGERAREARRIALRPQQAVCSDEAGSHARATCGLASLKRDNTPLVLTEATREAKVAELDIAPA